MITEKEFRTQYPCPNCGKTGVWDDINSVDWNDPEDWISTTCKICGGYVSGCVKEISLSEALRNRKTLITEKEFRTQYPCPNCGKTGIWDLGSAGWSDDPDLGLMADCKNCGYHFYEMDLHDVSLKTYQKKVEENIGFNNNHKAPWESKYYKHPCPYCGAYKVRSNKWDDFKYSFAFWGIFSSKLHDRYKCDACGKSWR